MEEAGGARGRGAASPGAGGKRTPKLLSVKKQVGDRPAKIQLPHAPREVNSAVGREKRSAHAARASLASPVSPAAPSHFHKRKCHLFLLPAHMWGSGGLTKFSISGI